MNSTSNLRINQIKMYQTVSFSLVTSLGNNLYCVLTDVYRDQPRGKNQLFPLGKNIPPSAPPQKNASAGSNPIHTAFKTT